MTEQPVVEIQEIKGHIFLVHGGYKMCECSHISDARYLKMACEALVREREKETKKSGWWV